MRDFDRLSRACQGVDVIVHTAALKQVGLDGLEEIVSAGRGRDLPRDVKQRAVDSFAYEWQRFGGLREEWRKKDFIDYTQPHTPESFAGRLVLDVGTGSGRYSFHAAELGARVVGMVKRMSTHF